jgi:hypothetical protein
MKERPQGLRAIADLARLALATDRISQPSRGDESVGMGVFDTQGSSHLITKHQRRKFDLEELRNRRLQPGMD